VIQLAVFACHLGLSCCCCLLSLLSLSTATLLKHRLRDDDSVDMLLFFGFIGLANTVLLWPFLPILHYTGVEPFVMPSASVFAFLLLNGALSVLSDYLWARSILITSPLLGTIGLSLTIPVAMVFDFAWNGVHFSVLYFVGSVLVITGFLAVNWSYTHAAPVDEAAEEHAPPPRDGENHE
jgi:solute carrier family 35 protein F5